METHDNPEPASIGRDAKDLAGDVVDKAKGLATEQVSERRERSAEEINKVASALRRASHDVGDAAAPYLEKAAGMFDRLATSVKDKSLRDVVDATERFARREPMVFLGGAFAIGLVVSRFFKSSERRQ